MKQHCFFCHQSSEPVHVHGHYQCAVCHTNIMPCCDSDNCDTNLLLEPLTAEKNYVISEAMIWQPPLPGKRLTQ